MALKNYSIVVNDYSGTDRENAIQALIDICGYIRSDATEIIDDLPQEIIVDVDGETAEKIAQALDAEGLDAEIYNEDETPVEYETKRSEGSGFWKVLGVAALAAVLTRRHRRPPYYHQTLFGGWRRPRRRMEVRPAPRRPKGFGARVYPKEPGGMNPGPGRQRNNIGGGRPVEMNRPGNNAGSHFGMGGAPTNRSTNNRPAGGMSHSSNNHGPKMGGGPRGGISGGPRGGMGSGRGGRGPGR